MRVPGPAVAFPPASRGGRSSLEAPRLACRPLREEYVGCVREHARNAVGREALHHVGVVDRVRVDVQAVCCRGPHQSGVHRAPGRSNADRILRNACELERLAGSQRASVVEELDQRQRRVECVDLAQAVLTERLDRTRQSAAAARRSWCASSSSSRASSMPGASAGFFVSM